MTVRIAYVDESYDAQKFVLSAVCIRHGEWRQCFDRVREFRVLMKQEHGLFLRKEIHASEFLSGRGRVSDKDIGKWQRSRIFRSLLQVVASLPQVLVFNVCLEKAGETDVHMKAWDRLVNRLERSMVGFENREMPKRKAIVAEVRQHLGEDDAQFLESRLLAYAARTIIVADEGREHDIRSALRRMHAFNPVPSQFGAWPAGQRTRNITTDRLIEDPIFRPSHQSYFLQLADCVAYALLKREVTPTPHVKKYGLHEMFDEILTGVCYRPASKKDALGIVRK